MKIIAKMLLGISLCLLLNSCSMSDAAVAGVTTLAGVAGHELSDGDPLITAASVAGGFLVSNAVANKVEEGFKNEYEEGFKAGQTQAAKDNYWYIQRLQQQNQVSKQPSFVYKTYEFKGAEEKNGVKYLPHNVKLRVIEDVRK